MLKLNRKWHHLLPLAVCVAIAPIAWAEPFTLDSVDFISSGEKTDIILHTGSIVPYQKVLVSDNKLIFEIDQVSTENTVRTNFSGADNISHVIVQPLSDQKIRLIVRGENLGSPTIAFTNPASNATGFITEDTAIIAETSAALNDMQNTMTQPATLDNESGQDDNMHAAVDAPVAMTTIEEEPATPVALDNPLKPLATTTEAEASNGLFGGMDGGFFNFSSGGQWTQYLPYGLLGILILGAGAFIRRKFAMMQQQPSFEDLVEEQAQGKRVGFREMATAYRAKTGKATRPERPELQPANDIIRPDAAPIGLRGLGRPAIPVAQQQPPVTEGSKRLDAILAASMLQQGMQKTAIKTPPPKKQALNNYIKQSAQPQGKPQNNAMAAKKSRNRALADQLMHEEMQRTQLANREVQREVLKKPATRPAMAPAVKKPENTMHNALGANQIGPHEHVIRNKAKKPGVALPPGMSKQPPARQQSQAPLQGNPQVLDFLRNVADLMEKDGKPNIAQSIQRNLGPV